MASASIIRTLRETKVYIIHPDDEDGLNLQMQIKRIGCQVALLWPHPKKAPDDADIILFLAEPDREADLQWIDEERRCALIAIIAYESPLLLEVLSGATVHGVISKPIRSFGVLASLVTGLSTYRYESTLLTRIAKLDETLRTRRLVEKATRILAQTHSISDDDAYAVLRREAMNKQLTLHEMATSIINAGSLLTKGVRDDTK